MGKYPKIYRCSLCGGRYAVLESVWHVSASYRVKLCRQCTTRLLKEYYQLRRKH